ELFVCNFFFQAEDGIRDPLVTGVQTCALPISGRASRAGGARDGAARSSEGRARRTVASAGTRPAGGGSPSGPRPRARAAGPRPRSEEHTSELQSRVDLVCRLLLAKKKQSCTRG